MRRHAAIGQWWAERDVQARGDVEGTAATRAAAAKGVAGRGGALPHLQTIQRSFGRHDVSAVRAHVGGQARQAAEAMGAEAYATGDAVAFRDAPSLHTAAHEAAHVVQQRGGVQLKGGVGQTGDRYEQHADAVADAVVRGRSAEALLDRGAGGGGAHEAVQRRAAKGGDPTGGKAEKGTRGKKSGGGRHTLTGNATTTTYQTLMGLFGKLSAPGSADFGVSLGLALGVGKAASLSGTIALTIGAEMQDDRRLRVGGSIGLQLAAGVDLGFWKAEVGVELTRKGTWIFDDAAHLCAWVARAIADYVRAARKYVTAKARAEATKAKRDLTPAEKAQMLKLRRQKALVEGKAANAPTVVATTALALSAKVKGGSGLEGKISGTTSRSTFTRTNRKTGLRESTASTETELKASLTVGDFTGSITYSQIDGDANPDNDGTYLNVKIEGGSEASKEEKAMQGVVNTLSGMVPGPGAKPQAFTKSLIDKAKTLLAKVSRSKRTNKSSTSYGVELNYVDKRGWRLQYGRLFHARSKSTSLTVPIGGALSLGGSAKGSIETVVPGSEVLGTDTLTYAQTVYNGMARRGSGGLAMWRGWAKSNQVRLWGLMVQAGKAGTGAHAEAREGAFKPFGAACESAFTAGKLGLARFDKGVYGGLLAKMESVFEAAGNEKSGWVPKDRVKGTIEKLHLRKVQLGKTMRCPVTFKGWGRTLGDFIDVGGCIELSYVGWTFQISKATGPDGFADAFQKHHAARARDEVSRLSHVNTSLQAYAYVHWDPSWSREMDAFWGKNYTSNTNSDSFKMMKVLVKMYLRSIYDGILATRSPTLVMGKS